MESRPARVFGKERVSIARVMSPRLLFPDFSLYQDHFSYISMLTILGHSHASEFSSLQDYWCSLWVIRSQLSMREFSTI